MDSGINGDNRLKDFPLEILGEVPTDVKALPGYENQNFILEFNDRKAILKTYTDPALLSLLEAENELLLYLRSFETSAYPCPLTFKDGAYIKMIKWEGNPVIVRLLSYLEGSLLGDMVMDNQMAESLGSFMGELNLKTLKWNHPEIRARRWEWHMATQSPVKERLAYIADSRKRSIAHHFINLFNNKVLPHIQNLRQATLHNDSNEWNLLAEDNRVCGIIDFGDLAYGPLVFDPAIAMAYASYDKPEPLSWAYRVLKGYQKVLPLEEFEIHLLYYIVAMRLCLSVANSAKARFLDPENEYISVSEDKAWSMLSQWIKLSPRAAENSFRKAAGLPPLTGKSISNAIHKRSAVLSPVYSITYHKPIYMEGAAFQYMYDANGATFLDAYNNIPHVGHNHPYVLEAAQTQMAQLNTNTRYLYEQLPIYAEKLLSKFPTRLNKIFLVNSGSEATDLAIRLAQTYTGKKKMAVLEHGYHGSTRAAIEVSDYKFSKSGGIGQEEHIVKLPLPDYMDEDHVDMSKSLVAEAVGILKNSDGALAGFIHETILGCAGQVPLPKGYLQAVYKQIRSMGGVCIADEVQTGFGRAGTHFWAFESHAVIPDIVILGKPMGNGHPMGAVITTDEIASNFDTGVEFFSSFGGNPVSCAIGEAVLDVIEQEGLQQRAKEVGDYYIRHLKSLQDEHPFIGSIRGSGLFLGIEVLDREGKPGTELAETIINELRDKHILLSTDGPYNNILKSKPPLCFTRDNCNEVIRNLKVILQKQ